MIGNNIKTLILLTLLTVVLLGIGQLIGGTTGLTIALIFALIMNFVSFWFSDKIVLFMYRAKEADVNEHSRIHEIVRDVAARAGLPKPRVFIIQSANPNAFATGRGYKNSAIAFTTGILTLLDDEELRGVTAHEMAHIKNRDVLISSIAAVIAGAIAYIAFMARWAAIFGGFGGNKDRNNILEIIILAILAPLIATLIRLAISRSREYVADETGAKIVRNPIPLANALLKLNGVSSHTPMKKGNQATSHLFIINPFSGNAILNLFSTHPSVQSRVGKLRAMKI